ncbi:hypothetical protein NS184_10550 [Curtobacterium luteum]|uniref:Uncharacterized protein n=1 Tax=Curtobacterium luteum TaxID=33881 RepID=A0A175RQE9_9MICO|nr:hypothetical protein NS184_10550 [Curtobacterium luteum]
MDVSGQSFGRMRQNLDVEVALLRDVLPGPPRRAVVLHPLEREDRPEVGEREGDLRPVLVGRDDLAAEESDGEARQRLRVGAVEDDGVECADHGRHARPVSAPRPGSS